MKYMYNLVVKNICNVVHKMYSSRYICMCELQFMSGRLSKEEIVVYMELDQLVHEHS